MKSIIAFFSFLFFSMLFLQFEPPVAIAAFLISGIALSVAYMKIETFMLLREYAEIIENIYVVSNHPKTNEEVFHETLQEFIVNVKFDQVFIEVENQKELLRQSMNDHFCDPYLKDNQKLQVKSFIFQDGEFINETFQEFENRVIESIKIDRVKRHTILKNANADWYEKFSNFQSGVSWKK